MWISVDFGYPNRAKLAPKWDQKSTLTPKRVFSKNNSFPNEQLRFFWIKGVQVESQNRPEIDQKMESKMECILASIFERFWWILGPKMGGIIEPRRSGVTRWEPKSIKNRSWGCLGAILGCPDLLGMRSWTPLRSFLGGVLEPFSAV